MMGNVEYGHFRGSVWPVSTFEGIVLQDVDFSRA